MKIKININNIYKTLSTKVRNKTASISSQCDDKLLIFDYTKKGSILY